MMKIFKSIFITVAILFISSIRVQAQECSDLNMLSAIIGSWQETTTAGVTRETWEKVSNNTYEGVGATYDILMREKSMETLRIVEMSDEIFYLAKVEQNEFPIAFKLTECNENRFKFVNRQHDFPQTITYEINDQNSFRAIVHGQNDEGFEINFKRMTN